MASQDLASSIKVVNALTPIIGNNTTEGTGLSVDTLGYEGAALAFHIGISGDTLSGTVLITPSVEEADATGGPWTAVAAANLKGTLTVVDDPAEDDVVQEVGYLGTKRWIRPLFTFTGTHTVGTPISAVAILGNARHLPV